MSERPVLLIDSLNAFCRTYAAFPTMSAHGYQMGGTIGYLKTLKRLMYEVMPSAIYIAWEGGGSARRRKLFSEYKLNRRAQKLNRFYEDDIPDSDENKQHQIVALLNMLKNVPVCQLYAADCEGDDLVAYLSCNTFKDANKVIVSSDKDLYQLLDERTKQYSLHRKTFVTSQTVLDEYRIASHNFAVAKALCGDRGDNVPGIKGLGFKRVAKHFPQLGTEETILIQDIFDYSHAHMSESMIFKRVLENEDAVKRNWKLVFLNGNMLPASQKSRIDNTISTFKPKANKIGLMKQLMKEGISDFNIEEFFFAFNCVDGLNYH